MVAPETVRVAVFIDWQNAYRAARRAFGLERMPVERGNFSPYRLGQLLAAANGRGRAGRLVRVEVHRGLPSPKYDLLGYNAVRRQAKAWKTDNPRVVVPRLRPLRYRNYPAQPPTEKGVDVALAVSAIEAKLRNYSDVVIVFSHDMDLLPVPEAIARLAQPAQVETASWSSGSFRQRLRPRPPVAHHAITQQIFEAVETPVNYAHRRPS
ncbi:MAG TPA: NYN domain-containing protein [Solirubrobacterales bacterium]|nr:NYN domain-containing protein [Solirubrobacterales bacterium]